MRTRDEVLREFSRPYQSHEDVGGPDADRMADRIRELESQQAASEPVAWAVFSEKGHLQYVTLSENEAKADESLGRKSRPLYAHPSAAGVTVTEAMVDAFMAAYAKCEQDNEWIFTHRMGVREAMCAALTAASEGASA